jgi:Zn finger protein HypA/HybF involved in hydrogenase expression
MMMDALLKNGQSVTKVEKYAEEIKNKLVCPRCYKPTTPEDYKNRNPNWGDMVTKNCIKCREKNFNLLSRKRRDGTYNNSYYYKSTKKRLEIVLGIMSLVDEEAMKKAVEDYKKNSVRGVLEGFVIPQPPPEFRGGKAPKASFHSTKG